MSTTNLVAGARYVVNSDTPVYHLGPPDDETATLPSPLWEGAVVELVTEVPDSYGDVKVYLVDDGKTTRDSYWLHARFLTPDPGPLATVTNLPVPEHFQPPRYLREDAVREAFLLVFPEWEEGKNVDLLIYAARGIGAE